MSAQKNQESLAAAQFSPQAAAYVASQVHAQGEDLHYLVDIMRGRKDACVLDLGCGGGHVSFHVAPEVARWSPMIFHPTCWRRSTPKLCGGVFPTSPALKVQPRPCRLPMPSSISCCAGFPPITGATCRGPWRNAARAEADRRGASSSMSLRRPCRCSIRFCRRSRSCAIPRMCATIRRRNGSAWRRSAGLRRGLWHCRRLPLDFAAWIARMNTPELHVRAIRSLQSRVAEEVRAHFDIRDDGSFTIDVMTLALSI